MDLGYSLLGGDLYKMKGVASAGGSQVHVFFDKKLALNLAQASDRKIDEWAKLAAEACSP